MAEDYILERPLILLAENTMEFSDWIELLALKI